MSETPETVADEKFVDQAALAEQKRADAGVGTQSEDAYVDALLVEREGYARYGRADRVAEVDEQLALRGYKAAGEARAAAAPKVARGRGSRPQQTA
jgi:hypothetical protein